MPAIVQQLDDKPVILLEFADDVSAHEVADAYMKSASLMHGRVGKVYHIVDVSQAGTSYQGVATVLGQILGGPGALSKLGFAFVGDNSMEDYFSQQRIPFCDNLNDAIARVAS
ncbi:MAG: hypothetical protein D6737_18955 [Chloroflexi bacterium]|nr:MAG: hypothetical protein D6737_18955 [Chloroflexota bacterium]